MIRSSPTPIRHLPRVKKSRNKSDFFVFSTDYIYVMAEAICTMVVLIRILIRTTGTTVVGIKILIGMTGI